MSRRPSIAVRLPAETARALEQISKFSGESVPTILRVILAVEVLRHKRHARVRK